MLPVEPWVKVPLWLAVTVTSGAASMTIESDPEVVLTPPPLTLGLLL